MRDPVLKAGAIVGCLVALWTLLTLEPADGGAVAGARDDLRRALERGDNVRAAASRLELALGQNDFFDHGKWQYVGELLSREDDPIAALERFGQTAPPEVADRLAAEGFAAYYLGYRLMTEGRSGRDDAPTDRDALADRAWRRGVEVFERLNRDPSDDLMGWDLLYEARTLMRLERDEDARRLLERMDMAAMSSGSDARRDQAAAAIARTMAEVGLPDRAAPLLDRVIEAGNGRDAARHCFRWIRTADGWANSREPGAALAVYEAVARYALEREAALAGDPLLGPRVLERLSDRFAARGLEEPAARMTRAATRMSRANAERTGALGAWMDVARQAHEAGEMASAEDAVLNGLREGGVGVAP